MPLIDFGHFIIRVLFRSDKLFSVKLLIVLTTIGNRRTREGYSVFVRMVSSFANWVFCNRKQKEI